MTSVRVVTISTKNEPFLMTVSPLSGYLVDLMSELASLTNLNYSLEPVVNKSYGQMVEMLERDEADIVLADLSVNSIREHKIDFSIPFMNLGVGMLYKKEDQRQLNMFSFLEPFTLDIWIMIAVFYCIVSCIFYITSKHGYPINDQKRYA